MRIKSNEAADKTAKGAIYMPRMTATRLPYMDYYPVIRRTRDSK